MRSLYDKWAVQVEALKVTVEAINSMALRSCSRVKRSLLDMAVTDVLDMKRYMSSHSLYALTTKVV